MWGHASRAYPKIDQVLGKKVQTWTERIIARKGKYQEEAERAPTVEDFESTYPKGILRKLGFSEG